MGFSRRNRIRRVGVAGLGLGFGIYVFPRILLPAQAQPSDNTHDLHMQGAVNFKGLAAKEATPNSEFHNPNPIGSLTLRRKIK